MLLLAPPGIACTALTDQFAGLGFHVSSADHAETLSEASCDLQVVSDALAPAGDEVWRRLVEGAASGAVLATRPGAPREGFEGLGDRPLHLPLSPGPFRDLLRAKLAPPAAPRTPGPAPADTTSPARALRVLAAEDNRINQLLVTTVLGRAGH